MIRHAGLALVSLLWIVGCDGSTPLKNGSSAPENHDAAAGGAGGGQKGSALGASQAGQSGSPVSGGQSHAGASANGGIQTGGASAANGGQNTLGAGGSQQGGTTAVGTGGSGLGSGGNSATGGRMGGNTNTGTAVTGGTSAAAGTNASSRGGGTTVKGGSTAVGGNTGGAGGSASGGTTVAGSGGSPVGGQTVSTSPADDKPGQNPFTRSAASGVLITSSDGLNGIELHLAADSKGGMFVAGATRNPQAMGLTAFDPGIESEAFAARLDSQGALLWSVPLKTCGAPADIAAGPDDAVFVLCPYEPEATSVMPSTCDATAVVEKLAGADGKLLFEAQVKPPAQPEGGYVCPYGLGVDGQGRSYVGGGYTPTSPLSRSIVIAVTAAGQQDWTLVSDGPAYDPTSDSATSYVNDVDVDANGNVLFVGGFNTWTKWGTVQLTSQAVSGQWSSYNGFFGRVPATGSGVSAWRFGGTVFDLATAVASTDNGGFVVGGWASSSSSIGGKSLTAPEKGSAMVAQLTSTGQATWAKALPSESITDDVAVGPGGKVYFVGQFANDEILYSYDPATDTLTPRKTVAGNATDNALRTGSVAVSKTGAVWLSGSFQGTINLGTGALSTTTVATFLFKSN